MTDPTVADRGGDPADLNALRRQAEEAEAALRGAREELRQTRLSLEQRVADRTRELKESEDRLQLAQRAALIGTWDWDLATDTVTWSDGVYDLLALPPGAVRPAIGVWTSYVHPDDRGRVVAAVELAVTAADTYEDEFRVVRADGQVRWLAAKGRVVRDRAGRAVRMLGVNIDVTDRREAEDRLRVMDRKKDEFLHMLGHELRTPLSAVRNAARVVVGHPDPDRRQEAAGVINRQTGHIARIVEDLLDVSRLTTGKIRLRPVAVDLGDVLDRAAEMCRADVEDRGHTLDVRKPDRPVRVTGDPVRLTQVFANLLGNAVKYTEPGGRIAVTLTAADGCAVATVRDTGIGITPDLLPRILDLYDRADASPGRTPGLGLGLTLVRRLVEKHGGTITARSDGPGRGSEFTIRLPLNAECGVRNAESKPAADSGPDSAFRTPHSALPRRVLVVDDSADSAVSLTMLLDLLGHRAVAVNDGPAALAEVARLRPEVVLLDIGMPGMDGYETARRLRELPEMAGVRLVALTGYSRDEDRMRTRAAGFDDHLVKPAGLDALTRVLASQPAA
jgi:signal transduction histidine kinase